MTTENGKKPGEGWSNGSIPPSMYPFTRDGRVSLFARERRLITPSKNHNNDTDDDDEEGRTTRALIAQLCSTFYHTNWATGTGGGVSIRTGGPLLSRPFRVFVAPSGVQKEDMLGDDVFELDMQRNVVKMPKTEGLRQSACTPLWYVVYRYRPRVRCVIHTHSMHAQMATLLDDTETAETLVLTHLHMLQYTGSESNKHSMYGRNLQDVLEVPIIDNRPTEDMLADQLAQAIKQYPKTNAVLVRRHGLYCWGDTWEDAKAHCEAYDTLFEAAVQMKALGVDCSIAPKTLGKAGTSAVPEPNGECKNGSASSAKRPRSDEHTVTKVENDTKTDTSSTKMEPNSSKKSKQDSVAATKPSSTTNNTKSPTSSSEATGFNQASASNNACDLLYQPGISIPLLPRQACRIVLPLDALIHKNFLENVQKEYGLEEAKLLKDYESKHLRAPVYRDVPYFFQWCHTHQISIHLLNSEKSSMALQYTTEGNLARFVESDKVVVVDDAKGFETVAEQLGLEKKEKDGVVVVCTSVDLGMKAKGAGLDHVVLCVREEKDGGGERGVVVRSLLQLCGV